MVHFAVEEIYCNSLISSPRTKGPNWYVEPILVNMQSYQFQFKICGRYDENAKDQFEKHTPTHCLFAQFEQAERKHLWVF